MRFATVIIFGLAAAGLVFFLQRRAEGVELIPTTPEFPMGTSEGDLFGDTPTGLIPVPPPQALFA